MNQARIDSMPQICNNVYYNSNSEEDNDVHTFHDSIEGKVGDEFNAEINDTTDDILGSSFQNGRYILESF